MNTKTIQLQIPEYLTVRQFQKLPDSNEESSLKKYLQTISAITNIEQDELQYWDLNSIKKVAGIVSNLGDPKNEFHSIVEWNGVLHGYSNIRQSSLAEYIDLESLCKDVKGNLHKIAAILYRPISDHRFDTLKFKTKQSIRMVSNSVENVFDYYDLDKYSSDTRRKIENKFKDFPVHIILGALSFFLANASQYLHHIAFSNKTMNEKMKNLMNSQIVKSLLANTGAGGGLYTHSLKPIYYQYQENQPL